MMDGKLTSISTFTLQELLGKWLMENITKLLMPDFFKIRNEKYEWRRLKLRLQ
jgi:hypothetical protein